MPMLPVPSSTPGYVNGYKTPFILYQSGTPFVVPSSGTMANNGAITLTTGLPMTYSAGAYFYLPAAAISSSSVAGWYWVIMSSATVGVVYNNVYTSGLPTPVASPTAFVTTGPGAYTQSVFSHNGLSITMPGGLMGPNGQLDFVLVFSVNNTANNKAFAVNMGATAFYQSNTSSSLVYVARGGIGNRNAQNSNISLTTQFSGGTSGNANNPVYGTIDTSTAQTLSVSMQLATATDYLVLESYRFVIFPS